LTYILKSYKLLYEIRFIWSQFKLLLLTSTYRCYFRDREIRDDGNRESGIHLNRKDQRRTIK